MATERFGATFEFKFVSEGEPGAFEGYGSVFDHQDSHGDIILPGAFADSIAAHKAAGTMPGMFAEHSFAFFGGDPLPIGIWQHAEEDGKGLVLRGKLSALDSDTGKRMRGLMIDGAMKGLSIAFPTPQGDNAVKFGKEPGEPKRWLKKIDLYSVDVVRDPANSAALVGSMKSLLAHADHAGALAAVKAAISLHRTTTAGGDSMTAAERAQMHQHLQDAHQCLTGSTMKAAGSPATIREFEAALRDAGFSNRVAREIAEHGFKAAAPRDEAPVAVAEFAEALKGLGEALRGLAA